MRRALFRGALVVATLAVGIAGWAPAAISSNDPYFPEQWALSRISAPAAWTRSTGTGIKIGVVDTGVDLAHEDLAAKVADSVSCIGARGLPEACAGSAQDDQGHGSHVAGLAAAVTGNAKGVAGVAPDAKLVVVKALGSAGSGALNDVNAGIKWAVDHGARVINLSLESDGHDVTATPGQSLVDGVDYAYRHNAIVVVAAGNATPSLFGASGYANVNAMIVGATGRNDEVAWYSSSLAGAKWGLVAPGGDARGPDGRASCAGALAADCVVSTGWFSGKVNQYADDEGTSMATPHVAGVVALVMAQNPALTATAAVQRVLMTADHIPCGDGCGGRVNAAAAVGAPVGPTGPTTTVTSAPASTVVPAPPSSAAQTGAVSPPLNAAPPASSPTTAPNLQPLTPGIPLAASPTPAAPPAVTPARIARPEPGRHLPPTAIALAVGALVAVVGEAALVFGGTGGLDAARRALRGGGAP